MKKTIISIVVVAALIFGYWTISPLFIDKKVSEDLPQSLQTRATSTAPQAAFSGSFTGFDKVHYGSGDVTVYKTEEGYVIRFEDNFNVANGPDLFVGLGKDGEYKKEAQLENLKGNIGSQNYLLPEGINLEDYNEVWIWCRAFSVGFAKAELHSI